MRLTTLLFLLGFNILIAQPNSNDRLVGGGCDVCLLMYEDMPEKLSAQTQISPPNEQGEPLIISGTIYIRDGKTPAPNIILYVYHTDANGLYSPGKGQKNSNRHGHLRGWIKTGADGKYQFTSIHPAPYPNRNAPQHIHPLVKEPGLTLYWIDEYLFDDDPLLTEVERKKQEKRGGNGIIHLTKNDKGVWIGKRDIILGLNISGY